MKQDKIILFLIAILLTVVGCSSKSPSFKQGDAGGELKHCIWLLEAKKIEDGIQCLDLLKARHPGSEAAQDAELSIGDAYFRSKDYQMAIEAYKNFLDLYPTHPKTDYAYYRIGVASFKEAPKAIDRDQDMLRKSAHNLSIAVNRFPYSAYRSAAKKQLQEVRARLAKREYYVGRFYFKTGEYLASIPRFKVLVDEYYDVSQLEKSLYYITIANIKLKKFEDARNSYTMLSEKFPTGQYTKKAEKSLIQASKNERR